MNLSLSTSNSLIEVANLMPAHFIPFLDKFWHKMNFQYENLTTFLPICSLSLVYKKPLQENSYKGLYVFTFQALPPLIFLQHLLQYFYNSLQYIPGNLDSLDIRQHSFETVHLSLSSYFHLRI